MREIPQERVVKRLAAENPWWKSEGIPEEYSSMTRRSYFSLLKELFETSADPRRAVVLMGPRRVGKTVMIHHLIEELLNDGVDGDDIFYVSIDHPLYVHLDLEHLISLAHEATGKTPTYVFFDEIQYLAEWERHLKVLVDTYRSLRIIVSGSAAAALRLKSVESGAGRFTDFLLPPLSFHEYLVLTKNDGLVQSNPREIDTTSDIQILNTHFLDYLNIGGYPEALFSDAMRADPQRFIKQDIIDKVLLRDLPSLYGITDVQELNSLFTTLAFNTSQEVSLEKLSKNSGVSKSTIKRYIEYLEAAFLLRRVHKVDRDGKRFKRQSHFKVYLANPSIRSALFSPVATGDDDIGALVETAIYAQWFHSNLDNIFYARWKQGEVDIVYQGSSGVSWAVEVKWSNRYVDKRSELKQLISFCHRHELESVTVTTRDITDECIIENVKVKFIPASLYCTTVGRNLAAGRYLKLFEKAGDAE